MAPSFRVRSLVAFGTWCLSCSVGSAQATWTVGSGGQFQTISAAVQAASDGDVILVGAGTYDVGFALTKGLAIVGAGAGTVSCFGRMTVAVVAAGRRVVLSNLHDDALHAFTLDVLPGQGSVHCEALTLRGYDAAVFPVATYPTLTVAGCPHLSVHGCTLFGWPGIQVARTSLACSGSTIRGIGADPFYTAANTSSAAIVASYSRVTLSACELRGGIACGHCYAVPAPPAMTCDGSHVVAAGTAFHGGQTPPATGPSALLRAGSTLGFDAACSFPTPVSGDGSEVLFQAEFGAVRGSLTPPGTTATFTVTGPTGGLAALYLGLPADPVALPWGDLWSAPSSLVLLQAGALPLPPLGVPVPVQILRGQALALQVALLSSGRLRLSPPVITTVP